MGVLIEHYAGAFPVWLAPVQAILIPIADRHLSFAQSVADQLREKRLRVEVDERNIGTGTGYSVLEVVRTFERVSGRKLSYRVVGRRPGDIEKVWADTALANRVLGWKAEKGLEEMLETAWRWEQRLRGK